MEYGFSILMFIFAAMLLLYALALYRSKDPKMIPRHYSAKMLYPGQYARYVAKIVAVVALAPILSGVVGLFLQNWIPAAVLVAGLVAAIWLGVRYVKYKDPLDPDGPDE